MAVRKIEVLRAAWGTALLVAPHRVLADIHHVEVDTTSTLIARILGARHLLQAALSGLSPSPEVLAMGIWVDAVHAGTAVGLAVADRSRARAGLVDAAIAGTFAGFGHRDLVRSSAAGPGHDRRRDALARRVLQNLPAGPRLLRTATAREESS